jgi:hypothetical protein
MPITTIDSSGLAQPLGIGTLTPNASAKITIANAGNQLYLQDTRAANPFALGLLTYNQDGNLYYDSNTLVQGGVAGGHIWRSAGAQRLSITSAGLVTTNGETRQVPTTTTVGSLPAMLTDANRVNVESAIVAAYQGGSGTRSFTAVAEAPHYIKKFFNMNSTAGATSFNQNLVEIDSRNVANFHELWIKITWGTRIQGISDAACALNERAYGCNKFNGNLINYAIANSWNHIDGNSDSHMDIVVVNGSSPGTLWVQYQQSSSVGGSSFIWGYIEIMSVETIGPGGQVPVRFNC